MPITRREIVSKVFTTVGGGYDADEVDTFLDLVADALDLRDDALRTERQRAALLTAEVRRLDAESKELRAAFSRVENADAEARELLEQAKLQARMVVSAAREEAKRTVQEGAEQAELIVQKARENMRGTPRLSERIAGYALRPAVPESRPAALDVTAATSVPVEVPVEAPVETPVEEVLAEKAEETEQPESAEPGNSPVDDEQPKETLPQEVEIHAAQREAEPGVSEESGESRGSEEPASSEYTPEFEQSPPFAAEFADPPMPTGFLKAERPAEFRPHLEIARPPRPEDMLDEAEGVYPKTDWLKDPDSRYEP